MNIGIDIDDTITNTYNVLIPMIALKYGMDINKLLSQRPTYKFLNKTLPNYNLIKPDIFPAMAKIVPLKDGVVETLKKLKEEGHKIIFITARNYGEYIDPYKISLDYLNANGVPFDKLIVDCKDKGKECVINSIDLFIDDNTGNCTSVNNKGIPTLQFDAPFNKDTNKFRRVNNWEEVYQIVQEMYV